MYIKEVYSEVRCKNSASERLSVFIKGYVCFCIALCQFQCLLMLQGIYTSSNHFLPVNCILIVFVSFIVKFFSFNIGAIVVIALSMVFLLLLINPISSAFCWSII